MIMPYFQPESNKIICKFVKPCPPPPPYPPRGRYLGQMLLLHKELRTEQAAGIIKFTEVNQNPLYFNCNVVIACGCTTFLHFVCLFKARWGLPQVTDVIFGKFDSVLCEFINNKISNHWRGSWKNCISSKDWPGEWLDIRLYYNLIKSLFCR